MMQPRWLLAEPLGLLILVMPKCGSQTVYAWIAEMLGRSLRSPARIAEEVPGCRFVMTTYVEMRHDLQRVCIVRDPVDRFRSLWKNKVRDGTKGIPAELYGCSPDHLLDYIAHSPWSNVHWMPQADYEHGLADELVPIERFSEWAGKPVDVWNSTAGDVPGFDVARLRSIYLDDCALYKTALEWRPYFQKEETLCPSIH